jgi:putative peptidoglycan lipid II flippase
MVKKLLNHSSKTVFSAAVILSITALTSRFLGLFRDRLLAGKFGAGEELDIYFAAFRLPDLVYSILVMGAISSAFIPVFAQYFQKDKKEAWHLTSGVFNLLSLALIFVALVFLFFAPWLITFIAPGFSGEKREMTIVLTRIMFLSPIFLGMSSILSGVLQYFNRFFISSLAPVMYNLGIICGIVFLVPKMGLVGLAWGVVLGAFLHFLIQLPSAIYSGFHWQRICTFYHEGIRKIIKLMIPRTIGLAGTQINFWIITAIASTLAAGSIAVFNLSNNLQYVPVGIIGISFATASFPRLAKSFAEKDKENFSRGFFSTFNQILFWVLPITTAFFLLRAQVVRIILGTGEFGWADTRLTAAALGIFSFSVFAQSLIPLVSRAFYSFHDTKTPVFVSLIGVVLNIIFSFFFVWVLKQDNLFSDFISNSLKLQGINDFSVLGLPIAFSLSGIISFFVMLKLFSKKIDFWHRKTILDSLVKMIFSCMVMAIIVYMTLHVSSLFLNTRTFWGIFIQTGISAVFGIISYLVSALVLKSEEVMVLVKKIFKK